MDYQENTTSSFIYYVGIYHLVTAMYLTYILGLGNMVFYYGN
jgi:hypothetical protein